FGCVGRHDVPRFESISETSLQHIEIYGLANHLRNHETIRTDLTFTFRYSLPGPSGARNIAGAVDVRLGEVEAGIYVMRIESYSPGKRTFSLTPTAKRKIGIANVGMSKGVARIEF